MSAGRRIRAPILDGGRGASSHAEEYRRGSTHVRHATAPGSFQSSLKPPSRPDRTCLEGAKARHVNELAATNDRPTPVRLPSVPNSSGDACMSGDQTRLVGERTSDERHCETGHADNGWSDVDDRRRRSARRPTLNVVRMRTRPFNIG